jgi:hypothetical protein
MDLEALLREKPALAALFEQDPDCRARLEEVIAAAAARAREEAIAAFARAEEEKEREIRYEAFMRERAHVRLHCTGGSCGRWAMRWPAL